MATMQALVKYDKGREGMELREVPVPEPQDGEVRLKIKAAGICGSDLHAMFDERETAIPVILGHEFVGVVDKICGDPHGLKVGDWVTGIPAAYNCGECEFCRRGEVTLCPTHKSVGVFKDGAMAEYMVTRSAFVFRVPEELPEEEKIMYAAAEPLACVVRGVYERITVNPGDVAVVSGPGTMGLFAVEVLRSKGARVVVSGLPADHHRLQLALELGAERVAESFEELQQILAEIAPNGADVALEAAGVAPSCNTCLNVLKTQGTLLQMGLFGGKPACELNKIFEKELTITSMNSTAMTTWDITMELLRRKKVDLKPLISLKLPLRQWNEGFDATINKTAFKVLLVP